MVTLTVVRGDITAQHVDAIVNAANNRMRGGGGVDGAIHRAAGPALLAQCIERFPNGLATGDAGWTNAGNLPATWVIHTVGPNHGAGERDRALLESCYRRALQVADEIEARRVAFPLISAGVYGWPLADAIEAAVDTIAETPTRVDEARLVAFTDSMHLRMRALAFRRFPPTPRAGSVGALFDRAPAQMGLRGDAYLWQELRARFADAPLPPSWFDLRSQLVAAVEEVAGVPLTDDRESVYVPEFDPGRGMSAGSVSLTWWAKTGIPILLDRYGAQPSRAVREATSADEPGFGSIADRLSAPQEARSFRRSAEGEPGSAV